MQTYPLPMVPGPVRVHPAVLEAYRVDYGSADLEAEYVALYSQTEANLKRLLKTRSSVAVLLGEGMMALWSALKSCLSPGDRVLAIATGVYGYGIGDMAAAIGAEVKTVGLSYDETLSDLDACAAAIAEFKPKMITAVHCETPSGTLNPLEGLGKLKDEMGVPLFYVDAVSSIGGTPVLPDAWHIDLCLGGAQKCLSALPDTAFIAVSDKAWEVIETVGYVGYDALKPFRNAVEKRTFPYTPSWHATAGFNAGVEVLLKEGLEACFRRHADAAAFCRNRLVEMGYTLFPSQGAVPSPTVTAARVPEGISWEQFDDRLRRRGLVVGGSYGPMAGKVFEAGQDITPAVRLDPFTGMGGDDRGRGGKTALKPADYRIIRKGVEVDHRRQIQVDPHGLKGVGGGQGVDDCQCLVIFLTKFGGAGRGRKTKFGFEAAHLAAVLIHGDEQRGGGEFLQGVGQGLELTGRDDVVGVPVMGQGPVKENDPAQVPVADVGSHRMRCVNGITLKSKEKKLSDLVFDIHGVREKAVWMRLQGGRVEVAVETQWPRECGEQLSMNQ